MKKLNLKDKFKKKQKKHIDKYQKIELNKI